MSGIIKDLIGMECTIDGDGFFSTRCTILDVDDEWVKLIVHEKKKGLDKNNKDRQYRIHNTRLKKRDILMTNFRIILAYNGTAYHGWQRQNNALAVQQVLEEAILSLTGQTVTVNGCSRTDAGVHARRFCASFLIESTITCRGIVFGLNSKLPDDISVLECEKVPLDFHARYMCSGKEYEYIIHNSEIKNPFYKDTAYRSWFPIDEKKLDKAAQDFVGTHDFKAMCSTDCTKENTVRTIFSFHVRREGELVIFTVSGDGFLYNMVRIMVGTLIFINEGKIGETQIPDILASKDRTRGGKTVPPQGLYLNEVYYDKDKGSEQGE